VGEVRDDAGAVAARVLDTVPAGDGFEALAVLQTGTSGKINLLGNVYEVESNFDP
jgi:hypothetical protein